MKTSLQLLLIAPAVLFAACGKDSTSGGGNTGPYACLGDPLPTTAPANVAVSGVVTKGVISPAPDAGATVTAFRTGNAAPLATTTTAANGTYSINPATGGTPIDGYLKVEHTGFITTYAYPPAPLAASGTQSVVVVTTSEFGTLSTLAGVTQDGAKGFIGLVVEDCDGQPIAGATVTSSPAGTLRYNSGGAPSSSATSTSADGIAYIFNVAPGAVEVRAQGGGHTLRAHTVTAGTDGIVLTAITPGP